MQDCFSVEYEMTDELASQLTRALLKDRRHFRQLAQGTGFGLLILMVLLFWPTLLVLHNQLSPVVLITVAAILAIGYWLMLKVLVYRYAHWATLVPFFGQADRKIRLSFSEDRIGLHVGEAVVDTNWKEVEEIQVSAHFWLFRLQNGGHFALPTSHLEPGLEEMIRRKAGEAEAEIHD
jgi:hypothetical protein